MTPELDTRYLVSQAFIATIYIVLLVVFQGVSFGVIQFRIAEVLLILMLFNHKHWLGLLIGTLIGNLLLSPIALDWIIGTGATGLTLFFMSQTKNETLALLWPSIFNGLIVGLQLTYIYGVPTPLMLNIGSVFVGEFVVTFVAGMILVPIIKKNKPLVQLLSH